MNLPFKLIIEKRSEDFPKWLPVATSVGAVLVAFIFSGIVLKIVGGQPLRVIGFFFSATFGSWGAFSDTLVKATPLILVGLACSLAFKMKMWNIGAEGQFYMGALGASVVILSGLVPESASRPVTLTVMLLAGMLFGAFWGLIPGWLRARLQVNEIITTLMMNYIAIAFVNFFVFGVW